MILISQNKDYKDQFQYEHTPSVLNYMSF